MKIAKERDAYPCKIQIEWCHNHKIDTLHATSFKDLSEDVVNDIYQYFSNGMTPGTAYKEYVSNLRASHSNLLDFHRALADRSLCPRRNDFNKLYGEYNYIKYGGSKCHEMLTLLEDRVEKAKELYPGITIQYSLYDDNNPLIVSFFTPMMH